MGLGIPISVLGGGHPTQSSLGVSGAVNWGQNWEISTLGPEVSLGPFCISHGSWQAQ